MTRDDAIKVLKKVKRVAEIYESEDVEAYKMAINALKQEPRKGHWIMNKVNILGQEYEILKQSESENPKLEVANGICEIYSHKIILRDVKEEPNSFENLESYKQKVLRHEIIHAFFAESGLRNNSDYAQNEELVDWIAIQLPKIVKVMNELDVL